ncbi:type III-B CRISPR module RAMP protein Cmr4 [Vulcanococcus limneticus]|uniref:type III-B CRISPR module RAMP protein Cmr4 n=1 Tax=Vulcanococcus limneticus TaxID=2170428 RepID=UPI00398BCEA4
MIETLAPLHVGASAGEETGNLNLIFRDAYTQTGIIPGSSIRGRFRAEARREDRPRSIIWFGSEAASKEHEISEARVKFEYASLVWLPVFSPGQPVVWVTSPRLLERYRRITGSDLKVPDPYVGSPGLRGKEVDGGKDKVKTLFFNLGFFKVKPDASLKDWIPEPLQGTVLADRLVVVGDADIGAIHDMALYRQSRVKLADDEKKVDGGAFFNVEALPEGSVLVFPIGIRPASDGSSERWKPFGERTGDAYSKQLYFGGLESVGFGRTEVTLIGEEVA